ncbi:MAG: heavy metal translocating P-type ATPase [Eubacteriales bacterium]|nr:heavy metal translocating P-type ATPase [Eubacteriales bacterium]
MEHFNVTGMSCAACQARVEKAVSKVEGVENCSVSLLTNSMGVEGSASAAAIIKAVEDAGYGASLKQGGAGGKGGAGADSKTGSSGSGTSGGSDYQAELDALEDKETPLIMKRLIVSVVLVCILMYFSMGHMMWGWPIPAWFSGNHVAMGLIQLLLAGLVMVINQKFFINGFKGLIHGAPNMDTLVALGSAASFIYSVWMLFLMSDAVCKGGPEAGMPYMDEFYFESAAMILALITVGKMLEARSKGRTTDALKDLMKLAPKTANVIREGKEQEVQISEVVKDDIFVVRPGESIPVDGIVLEGSSAVNEAALTGESIPVDKEEGSNVSAATVNQSGFIRCRATRVGEDTTLSQIIQMVSDAAATKAPIAKIADKVSGIFVPVVISIAIITFIIWKAVGAEFGYALARAISVLVISCPCALGLATPVAIMVGNGMGAKNGILYKTAAALENTGRTEIVVLDKTGTITTGKPAVTDIIPAEGVSEDELVKKAYSIELKSEHPLAAAVVEYANAEGINALAVSEFAALVGNGLKGKIGGPVPNAGSAEMTVYGGSRKFIETLIKLDEGMLAWDAGKSDGKEMMAGVSIQGRSEQLSDEGKTPLFFMEESEDGSRRLLGIIAVADQLKSDAPEAIAELKNQGIRVVMLTGDNARTARAIGDKAGVSEVIAEVLPDGKEAVVRKLQEEGKLAMVGDGINDAPALTRADIGIAIGAGTDVAIDAADVVLMKNELRCVPAAIRLGRATLRNIHENLFWAFFYNVIGIPLAAGLYVKLFGWSLNPMFGAAAMSLSSFCVVSNALRLNLFKVFDGSKDKPVKKLANNVKYMEKETNVMEKTMNIEGMMCVHCEATVKKALEALDGVSSAEVSHEKNQAVVHMEKEVADDVLKKAVEDKEYKVISIG